jgi:hypothetical protein
MQRGIQLEGAVGMISCRQPKLAMEVLPSFSHLRAQELTRNAVVMNI